MCGAPGNGPKPKIQNDNEDTNRPNDNHEAINESNVVIIENKGAMNDKYIIPQITGMPEKIIYPVVFDDFEKIKNSNGLKRPIDRLKAENSSIQKNGGDGSLSSGSSIVTISSDPEFPSGGSGDDNTVKKRPLGHEERWQHTALQVSVPFLIAGIGTIGAGLVLQNVEKWPVFQNVSQILILVPSLLGLKGNLDMCLASRLCTQANLGNMTAWREITKMIIGNLALVQIQAIVAATIVSLFATAVYAAMEGKFVWDHALLMTAASVTTATCSCFVLGLATKPNFSGGEWYP